MKRSIILIVLICALPIASKSQVSYFIPKLGSTLSNVMIPNEGTSYAREIANKSSVGIAVGTALEIGIAQENRLAIQPELWFFQKGFYEKEGTDRYQFNYLEIPILFKGSYSFGKLRASLNLGPSIAIGLGGNRHDIYNKPERRKVIFDNHNDQHGIGIRYRFDYLIHTGISLAYPLGRTQLLVEGRYGLGIRKLDIADSILGRAYAPGTIFYNRTIILTAGVAFPLTN